MASRIICWYSDGAASTIATKLAKEKYGDITVVFCNTQSEHPDNKRFRQEVCRWLDIEVIEISSKKYSDVNDVIDKTRFMRGPEGARCTTELKKIPRFDFQQHDDLHIFGYTADSRDAQRAYKFRKANPELKLEFPLIENWYIKADCKALVKGAGIELPMMYRLGFKNNNCIGCVKAEGADYWNLIRKHFPAVFERRALQERELNFAICRVNKKPVFLDELQPEQKGGGTQLQCDFLCQTS